MKENRIPFDIKYRQDIEAGLYKVETRDGRPARVVCWDVHNRFFLIVLVADEYDFENIYKYVENGRFYGQTTDEDTDLFLVPVEQPEQDACTITGWVARDKDGDVKFYVIKPFRSKIGPHWIGGDLFELLRDEFHSLHWKDEPIEVEVTIKQKKK